MVPMDVLEIGYWVFDIGYSCSRCESPDFFCGLRVSGMKNVFTGEPILSTDS